MRRLAALLATMTLVATGCGDGADATGATSPTTTATTTPVTVADDSATTSTTAGEPVTTSIPAPRDVTITSSDGLSLEARHWPGSPTWVVLGHMRPADMRSWFAFAADVNSQGLSVLTYNNRGYGGSDGNRSAFDLIADAGGAFAFAATNGASEVFYVGASMNGAAAFVLAAENELAGIATLSAVTSFPSADAIAAAPAVDEPLLVAAAFDDGNAVADAQTLADAAGTDSREIVLYQTGGHGTAMFGENPGLRTVLIEFFMNHRA